jgi:predicted transcriptional regulator
MHFNIYLDKETAERLNHETEQSQLSRNAIIREAIKTWINNKTTQWPEAIMAYEGDAKLPAFESYRDEASNTREDPFA